VLAIVEEGDEVLVPDPGWPNYRSIVQLAGGRLVTFPLRRELGYQPDADALACSLLTRTKAILVNSPANPTGAMLTAASMQLIMQLARQFDAYVVSDEVYEELVFDGLEHVSARPV